MDASQLLQVLAPSVLLGGVSLFIAVRGWRKTDYRTLGAKVDGLGARVEGYVRELSEKIDRTYRELSDKVDRTYRELGAKVDGLGRDVAEIKRGFEGEMPHIRGRL